jgi:membrane protease YdiL (CAAX protease family)
MSAPWFAISLLLFPAITLIAIVIEALFYRAEWTTLLNAPAAHLAAPLSILPFAVGVFLFGPLPEELGWRGYALDHLQSRYSALGASLILGTAWSLWHLPTYLIAGTFQNSIGLGSPLFWLFSLGMLPQSILMTWIYNNTRRSTLSAIIFHFSINFSGEFFDPSNPARLYQLLLTLLAAGLVGWLAGPNKLVKSKRNHYGPTRE